MKTVEEYQSNGKTYRLTITKNDNGTFEKTEVSEDNGKTWVLYEPSHPMVAVLKSMKKDK